VGRATLPARLPVREARRQRGGTLVKADLRGVIDLTVMGGDQFAALPVLMLLGVNLGVVWP
jgi:hypothetical protein